MPIVSPPIAGGFITSRYGEIRSPGGTPHKGLDIAAPLRSPVHAIAPGAVVEVAPNGKLARYGNLIVIKHGFDAFSLYAHLNEILVRPGQTVSAGTTIGTVGQTAGSRDRPDAQTSGPHLHLETLTAWPPSSRTADRVNPETVLADLGVSPTGALKAPIEPSRASIARKASTAAPGFLLLALAYMIGRN